MILINDDEPVSLIFEHTRTINNDRIETGEKKRKPTIDGEIKGNRLFRSPNCHLRCVRVDVNKTELTAASKSKEINS